MPVRTTRVPSAVTASSECLDTRQAARALAEELRARTRCRPDLLVVFASFHHRALFSDALDLLRSELHPPHLLACTAEGVIEGSREIERTAGMCAIALSLPGVVARPFSFSLTDGPPSVWSDGFVRERVSLPPDEGALPHRGILMLADPFAVHTGHACAAIEHAAGPQGARIFGGVASGASFAGLNVLAVDRKTSLFRRHSKVTATSKCTCRRSMERSARTASSMADHRSASGWKFSKARLATLLRQSRLVHMTRCATCAAMVFATAARIRSSSV